MIMKGQFNMFAAIGISLNVLAIILSPIIALAISSKLQDRKENRQHKMNIFTTLVGEKHVPISEEKVRALNMIDIVFSDKPSVTKLWREYFAMLTNDGLNNFNGNKLKEEKYQELIYEMAKILGYEKNVNLLDISRIYYPQGLFQKYLRNEEISTELLRVLKASSGFKLVPNNDFETGSAPPDNLLSKH